MQINTKNKIKRKDKLVEINTKYKVKRWKQNKIRKKYRKENEFLKYFRAFT